LVTPSRYRPRFIKGHHKRKTVAPPEGYTIDPEVGCWNWQLLLDRAGYGRLTRNGRLVHAHIYFYVERNGQIPKGLELDHLCRNVRCCNPQHMEAVTPTENKRRSSATKLTVADVLVIRSSPETNKVLAQRFGVDPSNISHIRAGRSWPEVQAP
jgi:hypothetical protein